MVPIIIIVSIVNFLGNLYLIYLFYQKYRRYSQPESAASGLDGTKIRLHRFNPFDDLGGDQSFVLCLLDNQNSGVIITSLHSRHHTRTYAKPIKQGKAVGVSLSPEETQILGQTIHKS